LNYFSISSNQLCPPYPECLFQGEDYSDDNGNGIWDEGEAFVDSNENDIYEEGNIGYQDTTNCSLSIAGAILPSTYVLFEPYPNPFNPLTIIDYSLSYISNVKLIIYDLQGRLVEILHDGIQHPNNYTITWDAGKYSSGIYLVQMTILDTQNNDKPHLVQTQKMVLLK
jgi:hypothetical protein